MARSFEKETADALRRLTRDVKELREEIHGEMLAERMRRPRSPILPTDENRRLRSVRDGDPTAEPAEVPDRSEWE